MSFREIRCHHCNKLVTMTNKEDVVLFCDEGCLNSYVLDRQFDKKINPKEQSYANAEAARDFESAYGVEI